MLRERLGGAEVLAGQIGFREVGVPQVVRPGPHPLQRVQQRLRGAIVRRGHLIDDDANRPPPGLPRAPTETTLDGFDGWDYSIVARDPRELYREAREVLLQIREQAGGVR